MLDTKMIEAVRRLAVVFARRKAKHALIGGLAVGLRSRPRATKDADFIVQVPALAFPGLLDDLVAEGFAIDVMDTVRRWSADRFIVFNRDGVRIDWMQPILPLYTAVLNTAEPTRWADAELSVATPAGLILTKLTAFRSQDKLDIETLLATNPGQIDFGFIRSEWARVAAGEEDRAAWFEDAIVRCTPLP